MNNYVSFHLHEILENAEEVQTDSLVLKVEPSSCSASTFAVGNKLQCQLLLKFLFYFFPLMHGSYCKQFMHSKLLLVQENCKCICTLFYFSCGRSSAFTSGSLYPHPPCRSYRQTQLQDKKMTCEFHLSVCTLLSFVPVGQIQCTL